MTENMYLFESRIFLSVFKSDKHLASIMGRLHVSWQQKESLVNGL